MADLLRMSSDVIDGKIGADDAGPMNRINFQLSPSGRYGDAQLKEVETAIDEAIDRI